MRLIPLICVVCSLSMPPAAFAQPLPVPVSPPAQSPAELLSNWLNRLDLGSENLCAAGVPTSALATVISAAEATRQSVLDSLAAADLELSAARADLRARSAESDATPAQRGAAVAVAKERIRAAEQAVQQILTAAHELAIADVAEEVRVLLRTLRLNANRSVPTAYALVDRSPTEWATLQRALRDQRVKESLGQSSDAATQSAINNADADSRVVGAKTRLSDATAVRTAFQNAIAQVSASGGQ